MKLVIASGTLLCALTALFAALFATPQTSAGRGTAKDSPVQTRSNPTVPAGGGTRKIPCKIPENASMCYWTHGRLSVYNGSPSFRIWQIGTRHILGVFNGPSHYPASTNDDIGNPELPAELYRAYEVDNRRLKRETGTMWAIPPPVFADFEVCPLRPERKGWMQAACIESAKNILVQHGD